MSPLLARLPPDSLLRTAVLADLDAVAELYAAVSRSTIGRVRTRPADLRVRWLGLETLDDVLLVDTDGSAEVRLAAACTIDVVTDPWDGAVEAFVELAVHPAYTRRGLGSAFLTLAEERASEAAAADAPVLLRSVVLDGDDTTRRFFARRGLVAARHLLELRMDLHAAPPAAVWPPGVSARTFRPGVDEHTLWQVHRSAFADVPTHQELEPDELLASRLGRARTSDPDLVFLAVHEQDVVGLCVCREGTPVAPEDGWVRDLGVVPAWRRRGIGMALLRTAFAAFRARGLTGVALEVDDVTLDGAVALYRRAGMRVTRRTDVVERQVR